MDNNTIVIRKISIFVADVNMCVSAKKKIKLSLTKFIAFFLSYFSISCSHFHLNIICNYRITRFEWSMYQKPESFKFKASNRSKIFIFIISTNLLAVLRTSMSCRRLEYVNYLVKIDTERSRYSETKKRKLSSQLC